MNVDKIIYCTSCGKRAERETGCKNRTMLRFDLESPIVTVPPVAFGEEKRPLSENLGRMNCASCFARRGEYHHAHCALEECPRCHYRMRIDPVSSDPRSERGEERACACSFSVTNERFDVVFLDTKEDTFRKGILFYFSLDGKRLLHHEPVYDDMVLSAIVEHFGVPVEEAPLHFTRLLDEVIRPYLRAQKKQSEREADERWKRRAGSARGASDDG